jgi:hypothetical protein
MEHAHSPAQHEKVKSKRITIATLMLVIATVATLLAYALPLYRLNTKYAQLDGQFAGFLDRISKQNAPLMIEQFSTGFETSAFPSRTRREWKIQFYNAGAGRPIHVDFVVQAGIFGDDNRMVLSYEGRSLTRPFRGFDNVKLDLKAEFPEAFR